MSHNLPNMLENTIAKIREMLDVNSVIGTPITTADGTTVVPISRVKVGFAGGGSEFNGKNATDSKPYGGGTGASVSVTPVAFLILKESGCRVLPIPEPASSTVDRIVELVPDLADKVWQFIQEKKAKSDEI
jgi:sporulation protein YtfJ